MPSARHHVLLVPGFLTEPPAWSMSKRRSKKTSPLIDRINIDHLDPMSTWDARGWTEALRLALPEEVSLETIDWPSQSLISLIQDVLAPLLRHPLNISQLKRLPTGVLSQTLIALQEMWSQATLATDIASIELADDISARLQSTQGEAHPPTFDLIGHSLGGRVILKVCERLQAQDLPSAQLDRLRWSAWAPAVRLDQLKFKEFSRLSYPPEVMFSAHDHVLKYLFPLGGLAPLTGLPIIDVPRALLAMTHQPPERRPLGLVGPPDETCLALDMSSLQFGHFDYFLDIPLLLKRSQTLSKIEQFSRLQERTSLPLESPHQESTDEGEPA